jgi:hypothetical protein
MRGKGKADCLHRVCMVHSVVTTTTCRQLGNDTTYDTEKKNPTSHDVADTSAVSGRRFGKTRHHVVKTNCGRHLKRQHFQLSLSRRHSKLLPDDWTSLVPLLQGWGLNLGCHRCSLRQVSLHESPLPIAPAPWRRRRAHLRSLLREGPFTSVSLTRCSRPNQFGPLLCQSALQVSAVPCRPQRLRYLQVSANHCPC